MNGDQRIGVVQFGQYGAEKDASFARIGGRLCGAFATDNRHKTGDTFRLAEMDRHVRVGDGRVDCSGHVPDLYL